MSARNRTCSSLSSLRDLVDGVVGERHARVLGLQAVDQVPEDPAAAAEALTVAALLAVAAAPARAHARHQHAVAWRDRADAGADLQHGADRLVAEDRPGRRLGHVALEDVQVGAADRRGVDPHDRIGRVDDRRVIDRVPATFAGAVVHESLHLVCLPSVADKGRSRSWRPAREPNPCRAYAHRGRPLTLCAFLRISAARSRLLIDRFAAPLRVERAGELGHLRVRGLPGVESSGACPADLVELPRRSKTAPGRFAASRPTRVHGRASAQLHAQHQLERRLATHDQ